MMNRFMRYLLLSCALSASVPAMAQPATSPSAFTELAQATQRETAAIRARESALQLLRTREAELLAAGRTDSAEQNRIWGLLEAENEAIIVLLDRLETLNAKPRHLIVERAILDDWYTALQPAAANLTEKSFMGLEAELAGIAATGAIEASNRRYPSIFAVRNRLAEIGQQLIAANTEAQRQGAGLRQELDRRAKTRERLIASLARTAPQHRQALPAWQEAVAGVARATAALNEARIAVEASATAALDEAGRLRPPILAEVRLSAPEGLIYRGSWVRSDGTSPDERDRAAKRAQLLKLREEFEAELGVRGIELRDRNAELTESAERMHVLGTAIAVSGERYRDKRMVAAVQAVAAEVGVTVAEVVLTGGAATLARQSAQVAQTALQRHATHAAAQEATMALAASEARLAARAARQAVALTNEMASGRAAMVLSRAREQMVEQLVRSGTRRAAAEAQADTIYGPAIRNAINTARRAAIDARVAQETARLAPPPGMLAEVWRETQQEHIAKALALAATLGASSNRPVPGVASPMVDTVTSTGLGESMEVGIGLGIDGASIVAQALGLKAKSPIPFRTQASLAAIKTGVGALAGIYKVALAQQFDAVVNNEAQHFGEMMAELSFRYATHQNKLQALRQFETESNRLKAGIFQINAALKLLEGTPQLRATPNFVQVPKGAKLTVDLIFSAPLAAPPTAMVESAPVKLARADGTGTRWTGSFVVSGETGVRRLSVAAGSDATPFGSLDSIPGTLAVRLGANGAWRGFEAGPDTKHFLPVIVRKDENARAAAPAEIVRGNEAVYRASDLNGLWRAVGYVCEGPTPEQIVRISTGDGRNLVAVKERGDNCIHSEELTWRGQLTDNNSMIQGQFHVREPNAADSADDWIPLTIRVISRDSLEGMGVRYDRIKDGP